MKYRVLTLRKLREVINADDETVNTRVETSHHLARNITRQDTADAIVQN